ncbi:MAG: hypothetical protein AMXMBFR75_06930 [Candidatus Hinthialibacteria bacterium]|nr:VOC family protein [bacterium]MBV6481461.1 Metallothiol transferase FosB [bacterium]MCC6734211.1 VOC family protein [Candidatus Omnitrophota bacterium]
MLPPVSVQRVLETCLYVDDLDQAEKFYSDLFGFELYGKQKERHVFFHCGEGMLLLFNARETQKANHGFPPHGATGPMHVAFEIDESLIPAWKERLNQKGISIEQEIIRPHGGHSIYFRDPSGNSIELATASLWKAQKKNLQLT